MVKYKALLGEKFDKSKITVVGSPTITSDGVASGFSSGNYIEYPITVNATNLRIKGSCIYKSGAGQQRVISVLGNNASTTTTTHVYLILTSTGFIFDGTVNGTWKRFVDLGIKTFADGDIIDFDITLGLNYQTYNFIVNSEKYSYNTALELSTFAGHTVLFSFAGTGNYNWAGKINLPATKIYADNQLVYTPTKPTYLLERRKPKVWNKGQFTVVGNPSISDDGVASGFSSSNYIRVPYRPLGQNFKIFTPKFNSSNVSQQQKIVRYSDGNIRIEIYQNKIRLYRYSGNNVYDLPVGKTTLQNNTDYYYYVEQTTDGTNYYLKGYISTDNKNWTLDIDKTYTVAMYDYQNNAPIQISGADAIQSFIGTLGLKQFKIYTDNTLVFDGGAETYVYDPSKFTIVGSPTITEYGVASGFVTNSSYIETDCMLNPTGDWKYEIEFTTSNDVTSSQTITSGRTISSSPYGLLITVLNGRLLCYIGTSSKHIIDASTFTTVQPNTKYKWMGEYKNGTYYLSLNGNVYKTLTSTEKLVSNKGQYYGDDVRFPNAFLGSINLPSTSITVDGKEVFTGAKENYYMLSV